MGRYKSWFLRESTLINKLAEVVKDIYKHNPDTISIEVKADVLSIPKLNVSYTASIVDIEEKEDTANVG